MQEIVPGLRFGGNAEAAAQAHDPNEAKKTKRTDIAALAAAVDEGRT